MIVGVAQQVRVRVHEAGQNRVVRKVNEAGAVWNGHIARRRHGGNHSVLDGNGPAIENDPRFNVDYCAGQDVSVRICMAGMAKQQSDREKT